MPIECSAYKFEFGEFSDRVVVAGFDGRAITSDAGALLLGATDPTIQLDTRIYPCGLSGWLDLNLDTALLAV
jgi:hypothetical protein